MPDDVIAIECPHCHAVLKTRNAGMVGKKVNCPKCSEPFTAKAKTAPSRPVRNEDEEDAPPVRRKSARRRPEPEAIDPDDENDFLKGLNSAVRMSQREEAIEEEDEEDSGAKKKRKKSAKRKSSAASDGPGVVWVVSGGIAALIGAAIWAAIGYFTEREIGWIAWGVGGLVGFAVAAGSQGFAGPTTGIGAAVMSAFSILLGKFLIVRLVVANILGIQDLGFGDTFKVLFEALHPLDALWLFLACGTAFKVGSGGGDE